MDIPFTQALPSILAIAFCIIILILLSLNYLLNRFVPSLFLIIFFVGILLWAGTKLVSVMLPQTMNETFVVYWKMSSLTLLILSLLVIAYFRDLLIYDSLNIPSIISTFLSGFALAALWFGNFVTVGFDPISGWNTDYDAVYYVILMIFFAAVYISMFVMMFRGLRKATIRKQKMQIGLIITGLAIAGIGGTVVNFLLNYIPYLQDVGDMDLAFVVVGFAFVAFAYLRSPIQIYFAPVSAYRLIVINNDGLPLLTHDFCAPGQEALTMDPTLISGALSGVINILKESMSSEHVPNVIHLEDRVLLLEKSENALCALICDSDSMVLRSALKDFSNEFEKAFKDVFANWSGLTDIFNDAYTLITEDFAFVISSAEVCEPSSDIANN